MKFVPRKEIDLKKWDALVDSTTNSTIYNKSFFLDTVSENWCIYVDHTYSVGIAVPFTKNLSLRIAYTPNFIRSLDVLGNSDEQLKLKIIQAIQKEFKIGNFCVSTIHSKIEINEKLYQCIPFSQEVMKNTLAKRMLKKFEDSKLIINADNNLNEQLSFLKINLFNRLKDLTIKDFSVFSSLLIYLHEHKILSAFTVRNEKGELVGCSFFIVFNGRLTYMKGVAKKEAMDMGVMYALLNHGIYLAKEKKLLFDFGGSNIPSIRRFFCNLGGQDCIYSNIEWGKEPYYYKLAKGLYRKINR